MAYKIKNYELPDKTILEEAYLRVQNVIIQNKDYEHFKVVDDPTRPDIAEELEWLTRIEARANVFVWADEFARKNRAYTVHWFEMEVDYNLSTHENVFEQAYRTLNKIFPEGENC